MTGAQPGPGATYAAAGVNLDAADRAVSLLAGPIARTRRPEVVGGIGGFAGLFDASSLARFARPLLATSTDGVGTKTDIARRMDIHDTIGIDLVAMVADDIVVCGAEPLFLTDYIACGSLQPERIAAIVAGIAEGCVRAGCALVGGETAEHPGLLAADEYDLAGAVTGVVDAESLLGPDRVEAGDLVLALASSGLHSNGFSLARHVFFTLAEWDVDRQVPEFGRTLGEELLEPTRIYALDCLALAARVPVHAYCHVTGGGLAGNLRRILPAHLDAHLDRSTWTPGPVFSVLAGLGGVSEAELDRTVNLGIGMVAVVPRESADAALATLLERGVPSWMLGEIRPGSGQVSLNGRHPG